jgi:NADPH2:quinone reductase
VAITQLAQGGLAEQALAPLGTVFDAPAGLDDGEAASFVLPFHTAHLALFRRARLEAGETLLVRAGASGVGSAAIQLGVAAGARVLATAGGPAKTRLCRELGAELAIDHTSQDFAIAVLDHTQDVGAHVVCDLVGCGFAERSWCCVAREGRYLCVGFADDPQGGFGGRPLRPACPGNFSTVGVMLAYVDGLPSAVRRMGMNPFGRAGSAPRRPMLASGGRPARSPCRSPSIRSHRPRIPTLSTAACATRRPCTTRPSAASGR